MLECEEGQTSWAAHNEEEDDGMTDMEVERKRRGVLRNILLKQLHQEEIREVDLLSKPFGHSFDFYVLYGMLKSKARVRRVVKYGSSQESYLLLPIG